MNAAIVTKQGQPVASNIAFVDDWPEPDAPAAGEALIRTEASAFNHMDLWIGKGLPTAFVHDLALQTTEDYLCAATHGKGIYVLDIRALRKGQ